MLLLYSCEQQDKLVTHSQPCQAPQQAPSATGHMASTSVELAKLALPNANGATLENKGAAPMRHFSPDTKAPNLDRKTKQGKIRGPAGSFSLMFSFDWFLILMLCLGL